MISISPKKYFISSGEQTKGIFVSGFCFLTLIRGRMAINGYSCRINERLPVFNPPWMPFLHLEVSNGNKATKGSQKGTVAHNSTSCVLFESIDFSDQSWITIAEDLSPFETIVENVSRLEIPNNDFEKQILRLESALLCSETVLSMVGITDLLKVPNSWKFGVNTILSEMQSINKNQVGHKDSRSESTPLLKTSLLATKILLCGAKGVGKSTCMRYLINRILSETNDKTTKKASSEPSSISNIVYVIDCDLGQPEFTPPGILSLHAIQEPLLKASHLNLRQPLLSFYLGDITSRSEPQLLSSALRQLVDKYESICTSEFEKNREKQHTIMMSKVARNSFSALLMDEDDDCHDKSSNTVNLRRRWPPLVVNTDGFVRCMGAEVLRAIVEIVEPTHVLHLCTEKDKELPPLAYVTERGGKVLAMEPGRRSPSKVAAIDLRTLRLASYFLGLENDYLKSFLSAKLDCLASNGTPTEQEEVLKKKNSEVNLAAEDNGDVISSDEDEVAWKGKGSKGRRLYIQNGTIVDKDGILSLALVRNESFQCAFDHILLGEVSPSVHFTQLLAAMNLSIVGLCTADSSKKYNVRKLFFAVDDAVDKEILKGVFHCPDFSIKVSEPTTISAKLEPCLGLGIIRHVDILQACLQVITPIDMEKEALVGSSWLLSKGRNLQLPLCLMYCPAFPSLPYLSGESTGEGSSQMKARSNIKRKRFSK